MHVESSNPRPPTGPDEPRDQAPSLVLVPTDDGFRAVIDHAPTRRQREVLVGLGECGLYGFRWDRRTASFEMDGPLTTDDPGVVADAALGGVSAADLAFAEALDVGVVPIRLGARPDAVLARRAARALTAGGAR